MAEVSIQPAKSEVGCIPKERSVSELLKTGYIVIDKPVGPSSHEVASYASKILGISKAGHTGTLDPNVSGVLVILLQDACKLTSFLPDRDKEYVCVMETNGRHTKKEVEEAFENFRGKIYQTPPIASAVARNLRIREIFSLGILEVEGKRILFRCKCEAGTYIRKLCVDAGLVLGSGGEMVELRRTFAMGIGEEKAVTLQELSDAFWRYKEKGDEEALRKIIRPMEELAGLRTASIIDSAIPKLLRGMDVRTEDLASIDADIQKNELCSVCTGKGELIAVAKALSSGKDIIEKEKDIAFDVERLIKTAV